MDIVGGAPQGMRALVDELRLAEATLADVRLEIADALASVGCFDTAPSEIAVTEQWLAEAAADVHRRAERIQESLPKAPRCGAIGEALLRDHGHWTSLPLSPLHGFGPLTPQARGALSDVAPKTSLGYRCTSPRAGVEDVSGGLRTGVYSTATIEQSREQPAIPPGARPPRQAYGPLSRETGIGRGSLHDAFERIKKAAGLRPDDDTLVDEDGNVYDKETGEEIGNIVDESVA